MFALSCYPYSYGFLQRILKFGVGQVDLTGVGRVLLLGLGGGSVVETLRVDYGFHGSITAVDIDPVVIQLARDEFNLQESDTLRIVCADALEFVALPSVYDLVIVDLFIDNRVPPSFLTDEFWQQVPRLLSFRGQLVFNSISETNNTIPVATTLTKLGLEVRAFTGVERTNTLLLARIKIADCC